MTEVTFMDKLAFVFYLFITIVNIFIFSPMSVVDGHWRKLVDGCILYSSLASKNGTGFRLAGSNPSTCDFIIYCPVFFFLAGLFGVTVHIYRCKFVADSRRDDFEHAAKFHLYEAVMGGILTFLALVTACMVTHGYDVTCQELRLMTTESVIVKDVEDKWTSRFLTRLPCSFFYSVMDFSKHVNVAGKDVINTTDGVTIAITASWLNFFLWITVFGFHVASAKHFKAQPPWWLSPIIRAWNQRRRTGPAI